MDGAPAAGDPVKNDDLWRELERATVRHRVRWHWVKGHSGQELNERAHTLASAEIARQRGAARRAGVQRRGDAARSRRHRVGEEIERAPLAPADAEVLLKLSCVGGRGAWAARVRSSFADEVIGGEAAGITANRLELEAAAELLSVLPERAIVDWRGGSDYLRDGASKWLDGWRRRGYRTSSRRPGQERRRVAATREAARFPSGPLRAGHR